MNIGNVPVLQLASAMEDPKGKNGKLILLLLNVRIRQAYFGKFLRSIILTKGVSAVM